MGFSSGGQGHGSIFTEINITPLTDIFLVLLIIMMVIAPGFQNSKQELTMPKLQSGKSIENDQATVEILKDGTLFIQGQKVIQDELVPKLQGMLPELPEKHVVVRADVSTPSEAVLKVFESAQSAGFEKLTVAGEPLSQQRADALQEQARPSASGTPSQ